MLFPHYCDCPSEDNRAERSKFSKLSWKSVNDDFLFGASVRPFADVMSVPFGDNKSFSSLPNSFYNLIWRSPRSSAHGIAADFARGSRRGRAVRLDSRTWNTYENSERAGNPWSQKLWRMQCFPRNIRTLVQAQKRCFPSCWIALVASPSSSFAVSKATLLAIRIFCVWYLRISLGNNKQKIMKYMTANVTCGFDDRSYDRSTSRS